MLLSSWQKKSSVSFLQENHLKYLDAQSSIYLLCACNQQLDCVYHVYNALLQVLDLFCFFPVEVDRAFEVSPVEEGI